MPRLILPLEPIYKPILNSPIRPLLFIDSIQGFVVVSLLIISDKIIDQDTLSGKRMCTILVNNCLED